MSIVLDVPRLRVLRAVVSARSIRVGAESLGYTSSAVSQQLASLQRETGLHLIDRAGRGIEPTAAAEALAEAAGPVFEALARLDGVVGDLRDGTMGRLSIGYFASAGASWLPPVVAALGAEFPDLRLELRMTENRATDRPEPDVDVFVEHPDARHSSRVIVRPLVGDPYVAVVRADHRIAELAEVPLADLAAERWVDNDLDDGACRRVLLAACAEAGFAPAFAVETHDYPTAIRFVATGIGITVVPELGLGELPRELRAVRVVAPTPVRHISIAVRKAVAAHPAAIRAVELLESGVSAGRDHGAQLLGVRRR